MQDSKEIAARYTFTVYCWWPSETETVVGLVPAGATVVLKRDDFDEACVALDSAHAAGLCAQMNWHSKEKAARRSARVAA